MILTSPICKLKCIHARFAGSPGIILFPDFSLFQLPGLSTFPLFLCALFRWFDVHFSEQIVRNDRNYPGMQPAEPFFPEIFRLWLLSLRQSLWHHFRRPVSSSPWSGKAFFPELNRSSLSTAEQVTFFRPAAKLGRFFASPLFFTIISLFQFPGLPAG